MAGCCLVFRAGRKTLMSEFEFSPVEKTCQLEKRINYVISLTCSPPPAKERRHVLQAPKRVYERPLEAVRDHWTIPTAWLGPMMGKYTADRRRTSSDAGGSAYSLRLSLPYQPQPEQLLEPGVDTVATTTSGGLATVQGEGLQPSHCHEHPGNSVLGDPPR